MDFVGIASAVGILGGLAALFGLGLGAASRKFAVHVEPKVEEILDVLSGANCGACGSAGCKSYAEAVVAETADVNQCVPGAQEVADAIAHIMGVESGKVEEKVANILCHGRRAVAVENFSYRGIQDCRAASLMFGGPKGCEYGCLALGTCAKVCPFAAIDPRGPGEIPYIDLNKCTSCGVCVRECPVNIISLVPASASVHVVCSSRAKGKQVRKACEIGCIGCGACKKVCPEDAVILENNLATIVYDKCTECGLCIEKCPTEAIEGALEEKRAAA
jgi:Na+-translocating ferredoxin:NAD+ oxidoreductase RNF subunit RnfB